MGGRKQGLEVKTLELWSIRSTSLPHTSTILFSLCQAIPLLPTHSTGKRIGLTVSIPKATAVWDQPFPAWPTEVLL